MQFKIDNRLIEDSIPLGQMNNSFLRLNKNALYPWFILIPVTQATELFDMNAVDQLSILDSINRLSRFVKENFDIEKLNIATIGNIVSQMHIHIIGRHPKDTCWPETVWGKHPSKAYTQKRVDEIVYTLKNHLGENFELTPNTLKPPILATADSLQT
ncbi:MAG: HIT family protein [Gammaproteobacteria bacterium]